MTHQMSFPADAPVLVVPWKIHAAATWHPLWVECKAAGGRLSPDQRAFKAHCDAVGIWHVVGGLDEVVAFLLEKGVISERNVPHYRLPKAKERSA